MAPRPSHWISTTILLCIVVRVPAAETNTEFVPAMWAFLDLSDRARLFFLANVNDNVTQSTRDETVGVHLDIALKPILQRRLRVPVGRTKARGPVHRCHR